ncbi:MAG TPA: 2-octaprenyl-6-methoxyphenyl hydroxylase [Spongiibacteraceae bacterium]|nr:2-octaprenyl-6-methoxyphenyl hydroxylase [Spongiibacteraceae bacterium]
MNSLGDTNSERTHYDVIIAGGGMVGISFALLLDRLSEGKLAILIAESFAVPRTEQTQPVYRPSFDARATALSYGSRCIFDNLNMWPTLEQHVAAITTIHVSERDRFGSVQLTASERGWPALGYVVENMWLGAVLSNELRRHPAITLLAPATVVDCHPGDTCATVTIERNGEKKSFTANLLAIADGTQSTLRTQLNIGVSEHDYHRQAIIANLCCTQAHNGFAYERFTDWGPMALLPLNENNSTSAPRMALVWTMNHERAAHLLAASDGVFLNTLQQRFGNRLGQFTRIGERHCYDLKRIAAEEQIRRQIVLIGNAAHSLHPVAGQGFNLALRDVQRLAEIICEAHKEREAIGELTVLQRYLQRQSVDQWRTMLFSDRVTALFERPGLIAGARHLGLLALDLNTELKNRFVDQTAGFHAGAPLGNTLHNTGAYRS